MSVREAASNNMAVIEYPDEFDDGARPWEELEPDYKGSVTMEEVLVPAKQPEMPATDSQFGGFFSSLLSGITGEGLSNFIKGEIENDICI